MLFYAPGLSARQISCLTPIFTSAETGSKVTGTPHGNDFPTGKREHYTYDISNPDSFLAHNLTGCIAPNEVADGSMIPRMTMIYGQSGAEYDRVISQTIGGTNALGVNAGGTLTFTYDLNPAGGPVGTATRTTVTDRNGNSTLYDHDVAGHLSARNRGARCRRLHLYDDL